MLVNPMDDINAQIDQMEWKTLKSKKWNPLGDAQGYLCAILAAALGLLLMNSCAHNQSGPEVMKDRDFARRY